MAVTLFFIALLSYLLGSIPWGLVISKFIYHVDLRQSGSGNIGSTNALRVLGVKGAVAVFVLDLLKGVCAGILALKMSTPEDGYVLIALALLFVVLGHIFSPWLRFKGGKGVACSCGCGAVLLGWYIFVPLGIFVLITVCTRIVSLASLIAEIVFLVLVVFFFWTEPLTIVAAVCAVAVIVWAHRANISRLLAGKEAPIVPGGSK